MAVSQVALHEKCEDALDGQRGTEDVAHEPRVVAPVGSELELEDDTGRHTHCEVDGKELHPEFRSPFPELVSGHHVPGLHKGYQKAQAESQGHEQPVIHGRKCELPSGKINQCC